MAKKLIAIFGVMIGLPILAYLLLLGASHVYVSGGLGHDMLANQAGNPSPIWEGIKSLNLPGLKEPGSILVDEVHAGHAIRNILFIFGSSAESVGEFGFGQISKRVI